MMPARPEARLPIVAATGETCAPGCITCGDVAVEVVVTALLPAAMARVRIIEADVEDLGGDVATVDVATVDEASAEEASAEEVSVALVDARVGDTILVHAGEAIAVVGRRS